MRLRRLTFRLVLGSLLVFLGGCAAKPAVAPTPARPTPAQRLASADALVREGCLDCLIDAFGQYDLLRTIPSAAEVGTAGAVRSTVLEIVDVLPAGGVTRTPTSDLDLDRSRALRLNQSAWRETLRDLAPASEF